MVPPVTLHPTWLSVHKDSTRDLLNEAASVYKEVTVLDDTSMSESTRRAAEAEHRVALTFKQMADVYGVRMAVLACPKFENYLDKIKNGTLFPEMKRPPRPPDVGYERGEHDVLLVHPGCGVLVVSVKSVGGNFQDIGFPEEQRAKSVLEVLKRAIAQLQKEAKVVEHVLSDLSPPVTPVLALPNVAMETLTAALQGDTSFQKDFEAFFGTGEASLCLCSDDLPPVRRTLCQRVKPEGAEVSETSLDAAGAAGSSPVQPSTEWDVQKLHQWFCQKFPGSVAGKEVLTQDTYEDIVGSCGEFRERDHSIADSGRIEVRVMPEAVREVSARFQALLLLPHQVALLLSAHPCVYMHGVMGSGKSVMLTLKSRHWLASGSDVIIVNVSYDAPGSPIGYALLEAINGVFEDDAEHKKAKIVNLRLSEFSKERFVADILSACQPADVKNVNFILDEVYDAYGQIVDVIREHFPHAHIWAAGLMGQNTPKGFHSVEMLKVLRSPPAVQRVLASTDYEEKRRALYTINGALEGLPSEGPEPKFILHEKHHSSSQLSPLDCSACGEDAIQIFSHVVGLKPNLRQSPGSSVSCSAVTPKASLSYKDIVLLCKDPESRRVYPKVGEIYLLKEKIFEEFVHKIDNCEFVSVLRRAGYPVRTVRSVSSDDLAKSDPDEIVASWINPASGLEWAVVVFAPGDPPPAEHSTSQSPDASSIDPQGTGIPARVQTASVGSVDENEIGLRAVHSRMSKRDREYLFWAASRCTAQLVVLVP
ncbi:hypothetical protein BaRGS_00021453 [Batillaria attramentaria]|uniref:Uncharacterized protein n=1 Tax=Batillaria attramentaria TaxID=370345 RepID=A0ABD0KJM6_9CAEN